MSDTEAIMDALTRTTWFYCGACGEAAGYLDVAQGARFAFTCIDCGARTEVEPA